MDGLTLVSIIGVFVGIFTTGFSAVYIKMIDMQKNVTELSTKMDFVYNNLNIALEFKRQNDRINKK